MAVTRVLLFILPWAISSGFVCGQTAVSDSLAYLSLVAADDWMEEFSDSGTADWQEQWFMDGLRAEVRTTPDGLVVSGGPQEGDDACHGVLWTRPSFKGDIKVSYTYTRTDTRTRWVNIIYLMATGVGIHPEDISAWRGERVIPSMRTYFHGMDPVHISYAAFGAVNDDPEEDYVRVRQYPVPEGGQFAKTAVEPDYARTGLFLPGVPYEITAILAGDMLYFHVEGDGIARLFHWKLPSRPEPRTGRIGLRQMYTRSARYGDFRVFTRR